MNEFKLSCLDKATKVEKNNTYTVVSVDGEKVILLSAKGIVVNTTITSLLKEVKSQLFQFKPGCDHVVIPDMFQINGNMEVIKCWMWQKEGYFM